MLKTLAIMTSMALGRQTNKTAFVSGKRFDMLEPMLAYAGAGICVSERAGLMQSHYSSCATGDS